jgi:hypothetical protein
MIAESTVLDRLGPSRLADTAWYSPRRLSGSWLGWIFRNKQHRARSVLYDRFLQHVGFGGIRLALMQIHTKRQE